MPVKPCLEAGCGSFATYRGRCRAHATQRDKSISRTNKALYRSKRWLVLRRHKLGLNPICESEGCTHLAEHVHHKHGVDNDPWSVDGLESLCASCHGKVTRQEQVA